MFPDKLKQMFLQSVILKVLLTKLTADFPADYLSCHIRKNNFWLVASAWQIKFSAKCCVVFEKIIARNVLFLYYFSLGKCHLATQDMMVQHSVDLSKGCDCISRDLLIAKPEAYGLDKTSLSLLMDYLSCWKQRIKNRF